MNLVAGNGLMVVVYLGMQVTNWTVGFDLVANGCTLHFDGPS